MPYKIVMRTASKKRKISVWITPDERFRPNTWENACTEYFVKKWCTSIDFMARQGYYPTYFETLNAAIEFEKSLHGRLMAYMLERDIEIWKIKTKNILRELPKMIKVSCLIYYDGRIFDRSDESGDKWPLDTRMAEKIKLIKMVYPKKQTIIKDILNKIFSLKLERRDAV